jgi:hypothetical protein
MDTHGVGWGGLNWMKTGENFNFALPQLAPLHIATIRD